jgi:hypothetical protein
MTAFDLSAADCNNMARVAGELFVKFVRGVLKTRHYLATEAGDATLVEKVVRQSQDFDEGWSDCKLALKRQCGEQRAGFMLCATILVSTDFTPTHTEGAMTKAAGYGKHSIFGFSLLDPTKVAPSPVTLPRALLQTSTDPKVSRFTAVSDSTERVVGKHSPLSVDILGVTVPYTSTPAGPCRSCTSSLHRDFECPSVFKTAY